MKQFTKQNSYLCNLYGKKEINNTVYTSLQKKKIDNFLLQKNPFAIINLPKELTQDAEF